jgi:epoxyqueuosine reductase
MAEDLARLHEWLERGYAGEMRYMHDPRRADPKLVLQGARSLVAAALNYNSAQPHSTEFSAAAQSGESPRGWISRYAWGDDYHEVMAARLERFVADMRQRFDEPFEAKAYVDTGPILERVTAKHAGLGWLAKNTCLINEELGSWLFLGVIITTLELAPTVAPGELAPADQCGNCTLCLDACPSAAFAAPYVLDARRCISYLTIELRGAIPEELRADMGTAVFGCDICQDVCPWNRKAPIGASEAFEPRESGFAPELEALASFSQHEFNTAFRRSAVKRAKWRGMVRNACIALGNSKFATDSSSLPRVRAILEKLIDSDDPLIREHAGWALAQIGQHN